MTRLKDTCIVAAILSTTLTSCIRDDLQPCPPLTIQVDVKDKNYSNVDELNLDEELGLDQHVSEDLPFNAYVPTLYYRLSRVEADNSKVLAEEKGVFRVEGEAKTYSIDFGNELPFGKYIITIWGGIPNKDGLNEDASKITFHPDHAQGYDDYLVSDTLVYDATHSDFTTFMRRTKGKLIIYAENIPRKVQYTGKTVEDIYQDVDANFNYEGETSVTTRQQRRGIGNILTETYLTPTLKNEESEVETHFYDDDDFAHPDNSPGNVDITMRRNELTVLKYVYDVKNDRFYIYLRVNSNWEAIHNMNLD